MEHLKYPIGKFEYGKTYSPNENKIHIAEIGSLPEQLKEISKKFDETLLEKCYRPDGWNGRQLIHHIADSHSNALIRVKLALTEDKPVIKPYDQDAWSVLADAKHAPVQSSVKMIEAIHERWMYLLNSFTETDLKRKYIHPEYNREFQLDEFIALYAWHGKHHCAHLNLILNQK
jgi:hypothetical protein